MDSVTGPGHVALTGLSVWVLEVGELVGGAEALGHRDLPGGPVAGHAVVGVEAGLPERLHHFQPLHLPVEGLDEEEAAHLAVAEDVDAGALLVADGELGGVVEAFLGVGLPVLARLDLVERRPEPAGKPWLPITWV